MQKTKLNNNDNGTNLENFKGIYFGNEEDQKFYEGGAHFKYKQLCKILEKIVTTLPNERRGKSMYEDWSNTLDKNSYRKEYSKEAIKSDDKEYSSISKTKADSKKIISENSKVLLYILKFIGEVSLRYQN